MILNIAGHCLKYSYFRNCLLMMLPSTRKSYVQLMLTCPNLIFLKWFSGLGNGCYGLILTSVKALFSVSNNYVYKRSPPVPKYYC